jgi:hypothetical protein
MGCSCQAHREVKALQKLPNVGGTRPTSFRLRKSVQIRMVKVCQFAQHRAIPRPTPAPKLNSKANFLYPLLSLFIVNIDQFQLCCTMLAIDEWRQASAIPSSPVLALDSHSSWLGGLSESPMPREEMGEGTFVSFPSRTRYHIIRLFTFCYSQGRPVG